MKPTIAAALLLAASASGQMLASYGRVCQNWDPLPYTTAGVPNPRIWTRDRPVIGSTMHIRMTGSRPGVTVFLATGLDEIRPVGNMQRILPGIGYGILCAVPLWAQPMPSGDQVIVSMTVPNDPGLQDFYWFHTLFAVRMSPMTVVVGDTCVGIVGAW